MLTYSLVVLGLLYHYLILWLSSQHSLLASRFFKLLLPFLVFLIPTIFHISVVLV